MPYTVPDIKEMFSDAESPAARAERLDALKAALDVSAAKTARGEFRWSPGEDSAEHIEAPLDSLTKAISDPALAKSMDPAVLASLTAAVAGQKAVSADLAKDISLTSPLASGLVPYDLEAPAKLLVPRPTPLRNKIARVKGQGTSRKFKRINGVSNSGTGGVANLSPFITDTSTMSAGSLTLRRGPVIAYAADEKSINYKQAGLSDIVIWSAEFAGLGFDDVRQLSQTSLLFASMLADERAILGGRGTDSGFVGTIAAPTVSALTARNAGTGETGNTANIATLFVYVTALGVWGESAPSTVASTTSMSAATGKVIDVAITDVNGALGYNVYCGTTTGVANCFFVGTTGFGGVATGQGVAPFSIQFTGAGTGGAPTVANGAAAPAADTGTASAASWDGYLGVLTDPTQSGYINRINGKLSTSAPGVELQNAFAQLYQSVKSDPDEVLFNGFDRKQLSESVHGGSSTPPAYRINIGPDQVDGVQLGTMVSQIYNEVTGKGVDVNVHPFMPQGNALVLSHTLPMPDSQVSQTTQYVLPQDYMAINWPVIQHTYDISTYWFGALVHYAPAWSGFIGGIQKA
jgi:hypothetical protein